MSCPVIIGTRMPEGIEYVCLVKKLKLGDAVLTKIPSAKQEALAVAEYCRKNHIYLCFHEFLLRGGFNLREKGFHSKADVDEIIDAAGEYYLGRFTIGEIGCVLYGPTQIYPVEWAGKHWSNLPPLRTMAEARDAYVAYVKQFLDYERKKLGKGPLLNVESGLVFKYHVAAGIDILCHESMPSDPHLMHAAIRGAARAFGKSWGTHIAMQCYGGVRLDELWQRRWKTSLYFSHISGADFIWPESGHLTYNQNNRQRLGFHSKEMKRVRRTLREAVQFAHIHTRPPKGPKVRLGVVHGNLDGTPGFWNRVAWGQYKGKKWLEGPPEWGWRFVDKFHRKEEWPKETVQGNQDFSGNPPCGQYDVVPIEAPLPVLKQYSCLLFLGWNTMTPAIYKKLKQYVKAGGHLVMYLCHLSTETDRAKAIKLFHSGDFSDLFGVRILGREKTRLQGINCLEDSSLKSYRFPRWRVSTDPRLVGRFTTARMKLTTAKVISSHCVLYRTTREQLLRHPLLIENTLGKGAAFLVAAWEFPADEGIRLLTEDILRVVLQGEQGEIRLLSSDRVRYAVYEGKLPQSRKKYSVIYLLNTDPDCDVLARLWIRGRTTEQFTLPANELRLAYRCGDCVLVPEDKCVDIRAWKATKEMHVIELFSARNQKVEIHNVGKGSLTVSVNGSRRVCKSSERKLLHLKKCVDPDRKEFFARDFLKAPPVEYVHSGLPY